MPSDAVKKVRTLDMKCCSIGESLFQSVVSAERSISLAVQKDASAYLYILQMLLCWMGKRTKRLGFAWRNSSGARWPFILAVLCFDALRCDGCVFVAFVVERAVFVQNSSQSLPLSRMKFVILRKAWYVTVCSSGIVYLDVGGLGGVM